jgi:4-hydroxybenzoate polyprenyltransferase
MLAKVRLWLELVRFSHTVFALPFALVSAAIACHREGTVRLWDIVGVLACMVFARSAAMSFNRLVDRDIDALNPRTQSRHLPAKLVSVRAVVGFTLFTSIGFVASTLLFMLRESPNYWPLILSAPVLVVLLVYSLTKRFTSLAHFWLGLSLSLAPLAAWIAVRGITSLDDIATPGLLAVAVLFWVTGFDVMYACQDADFDRSAKLHSLPARLGVAQALRLATGCHIVTLAALVGFGLVTPELGLVYFLGLTPITALLAYQHWLVTPTDIRRVNVAFFQVNAVISFGVLALVLLSLGII